MKTHSIMTKITHTLAISAIALGLGFASPAHANKTFEDFGGVTGLTTIMDDFMVGLVADPRTKEFFENSNQPRVKAMLVLQMCELLDGGCTYPGLDMKTAHRGMKVNRAGFNGLVEQFQFAMDKYGVPFASQNVLVAKLAPMYRDIEGTTGDAVAPVFSTMDKK
jgi:hemoglobin